MKKIIIYTLSVLVIFISCVKEKKIESYNEDDKILDLLFPDTVLINKNIAGKIIYNMEIDTLKKSEIIDRFMFLYVTTDKEGIDIRSIKNTNHKIFVDTIRTGVYNFKASFNNVGNNMLNLVFEDVVMTNKFIKDSMTIYEEYTSISLPVYVKEDDITESFVDN